METTATEVQKVLELEAHRMEQAREVSEALKVLNELIDKGLIEQPSYRLAAPTAIPSKSSLYSIPS